MVLAAGIPGPRSQPAVGGVVLGVGKAVDLSGFHGDHRTGDIADARDRDQEPECGCRPQSCF